MTLTPLFRPFLVAISALSFSTMMSLTPALAQQPLLRTLTVTGEGVETIATTLARVELSIEITAPAAVTVQTEVAKSSHAVVDFLRSRGVDKLQTTGIQLQPNYDYNNNQRQLKSYTGTNTLSFQVPPDRLGSILDEAVRTGATRINGVSFTATDDALNKAQRLALQKATQDAQEQAKAVLQSLNLTPKEIIAIQINGAQPPVPKMYQADSLMVRGAMAPAPPCPPAGPPKPPPMSLRGVMPKF